MDASAHGEHPAQQLVSVAINVSDLGLGASEGCTWPGTLTDVWTGETIDLGNGTTTGGTDPVVIVDKLPWHATRLLVVEVVCAAQSKMSAPPYTPSHRASTVSARDDTSQSNPLQTPSSARERTVSVWWKPNSLKGLAAEIYRLRSILAATDVLVYCGYAALANGSFGVSPNASQQTWGNITLCEAAVQQATTAGLRSRIMVEGRATLGFEDAVHRGGASFGAEMVAQVPLHRYGP
jgi:hypothetical protein